MYSGDDQILVVDQIISNALKLTEQANFADTAPTLLNVYLDLFSIKDQTQRLFQTTESSRSWGVPAVGNLGNAGAFEELVSELKSTASEINYDLPAEDADFIETCLKISLKARDPSKTMTGDEKCISYDLQKATYWPQNTTLNKIYDGRFRNFEIGKRNEWPEVLCKLGADNQFGNIVRLVIEEGYMLAGRGLWQKWSALLKTAKEITIQKFQSLPEFEKENTENDRIATLKLPNIIIDADNTPIVESVLVVTMHFFKNKSLSANEDFWPKKYKVLISEIIKSTVFSLNKSRDVPQDKQIIQTNSWGGSSSIGRDLLFRTLVSVSNLENATPNEVKHDSKFFSSKQDREKLFGLSDSELLERLNDYIEQIGIEWKISSERRLLEILKYLFQGAEKSEGERARNRLVMRMQEIDEQKQKIYNVTKSVWLPDTDRHLKS